MRRAFMCWPSLQPSSWYNSNIESIFQAKFSWLTHWFQIFIIVIIYFLRTKLSGLAALFEEASKCMYALPGLVVPSILAIIALALFLAFWVAVVICLATAKFPGMEPLIKLTPGNSTELAVTSRNPSIIRNNSEADYKSFKVVEFKDADWLRNMFWLYLIGLVWTSEFIFGN